MLLVQLRPHFRSCRPLQDLQLFDNKLSFVNLLQNPKVSSCFHGFSQSCCSFGTNGVATKTEIRSIHSKWSAMTVTHSLNNGIVAHNNIITIVIYILLYAQTKLSYGYVNLQQSPKVNLSCLHDLCQGQGSFSTNCITTKAVQNGR